MCISTFTSSIEHVTTVELLHFDDLNEDNIADNVYFGALKIYTVIWTAAGLETSWERTGPSAATKHPKLRKQQQIGWDLGQS